MSGTFPKGHYRLLSGDVGASLPFWFSFRTFVQRASCSVIYIPTAVSKLLGWAQQYSIAWRWIRNRKWAGKTLVPSLWQRLLVSPPHKPVFCLSSFPPVPWSLTPSSLIVKGIFKCFQMYPWFLHMFKKQFFLLQNIRHKTDPGLFSPHSLCGSVHAAEMGPLWREPAGEEYTPSLWVREPNGVGRQCSLGICVCRLYLETACV